MRVIAFNLGADRSTLYITEVGDFLVYPSAQADDWVVLPCYEDDGPLRPLTRHDNRRDAIRWIDELL